MNIDKIKALRIDTSKLDLLGVTKVVTHIAITKPSSTTFFRVHPEPEWTFDVITYEDKGGQEVYVVSPEVVSFFGKTARSVRLYLAVDRSHNLFLIPLPLPDSEGKWNQWHQSKSSALKLAQTKWIRIQSNQKTSSYDVMVAQGDLPEPEWPSCGFEEILAKAFQGRVIEDENHPIVRGLLGFS